MTTLMRGVLSLVCLAVVTWLWHVGALGTGVALAIYLLAAVLLA